MGAVLTREPGATRIGSELRAILLNPDNKQLDPITEAYLMAADRSQNMVEEVIPGIKAGRHVVSDRSFVSSIAYQGSGRGLGEERILQLNLLIPHLVIPDIMFLMMPPSPEELTRRLDRPLDRIEQAGADFHNKLSTSFGQMANFLASHPQTASIQVITIQPEAIGRPKSVEEIHQEVSLKVQDFCDERDLVSPI